MLTFGIKDIIDILLVALLLYYIWKLMKQSSAANIFTGVLFFVIGWIIVSRIFEMHLLGSIMDNLVNIGMVALVVLFQEEIRHFFSTIGSTSGSKWVRRLFKSQKEEVQHENVMPIVLACLNMSKQKEGALIVIERHTGLKEIIRTGELIDADINQRLIENIFFKNSPLHDGAMIISKQRITAAGCILPVSHNNDIPRSLGLRHRAALGMTQQSDCLAIVVSEETGRISVAEDGLFHLKLTAEELERILTEAWIA